MKKKFLKICDLDLTKAKTVLEYLWKLFCLHYFVQEQRKCMNQPHYSRWTEMCNLLALLEFNHSTKIIENWQKKCFIDEKVFSCESNWMKCRDKKLLGGKKNFQSVFNWIFVIEERKHSWKRRWEKDFYLYSDLNSSYWSFKLYMTHVAIGNPIKRVKNYFNGPLNCYSLVPEEWSCSLKGPRSRWATRWKHAWLWSPSKSCRRWGTLSSDETKTESFSTKLFFCRFLKKKKERFTFYVFTLKNLIFMRR